MITHHKPLLYNPLGFLPFFFFNRCLFFNVPTERFFQMLLQYRLSFNRHAKTALAWCSSLSKRTPANFIDSPSFTVPFLLSLSPQLR